MIDDTHMTLLTKALDRSPDGLTTNVTQEEARVILDYVDENDDPQGNITLSYTDDTLNFDILNFQIPYQGGTIYARMVEFFPSWARSLDLIHFLVPAVLSHGFVPSLVDAGFEDQGDGSYAQDISDPETSRIDQYNRWVAAEAPEPEWHKELPDSMRVTQL